MRRTQSIRKAIYALIVLAVFMIILRVSHTGSTSVVMTPAGDSHDSRISATNTAVSASVILAETHSDPPNLVDKKAEVAAMNEKTKQMKDTGGSKVPSDQEFVEKQVSEYDAERVFNQIVNDAAAPPVIIFSKSYCPHSMRAKSLLLEAYTIKPTPKVVELDLISHGLELQEYIGKSTGRRTVPNIMINGISRGGASDMVELEDRLVTQFLEWGQGKLSIVKQQAAVQE